MRLLHVEADVVKRFPSIAHVPPAIALVGFVAAAVTPGDVHNAAEAAAGPYEVFASGFEDPSGLAVEGDGAVLVTDQRAGTLTRISPDGARHGILGDLQDPRGVAAAGEAGIFVLEGSSRVLRIEPDGKVSVVSRSARQAQAIAAGPDGRIWLAMRADNAADYELARLDASGALTRVASGFVDLRAIAVDDAGIYVTIESLAGDEREHTTLARLLWRSDGMPGPVEVLLKNAPRQPQGLAIDAAGDVFITGLALERPDRASGVVVKRRGGGEIFSMASGLSNPRAAAFGPAGDLFVIDKGGPARILRFRPPRPPLADVPPFTNRNPLGIAGTAEPNSLVQLFSGAGGSQRLAAVVADADTGAFVVSAPLAPNDRTQLMLESIAEAGSGLVAPRAIVSVVHDDHLPAVQILEPAVAAHVRSDLVLRAQATDDGSGLATLRVVVDRFDETVVPTDTQAMKLSISSVVDTTGLAEGAHSLSAVAIDRAGNWGGAAQLVVVDRTAPDTFVIMGPPAETSDRSVTFTYGGSDVLSPDLQFAWRLDSGPWSPFASSDAVQLTELEPGSHRFEAVSRDLAGNIDATPAVQVFTVTTTQRIQIVEPLSGAFVTTETVWVRGTVEGGQDISLRIPLPELIRPELSFDALSVPLEAGTFAVEVPIVPGANSVTVIGRDAAGVEHTDAVAIIATAPLGPSLRLEVYPQAGLAPHAVRFPANEFPQGSFYSVDLESDGIIDYAGNALPEEEFTYLRPGIHVPTLRITTPDGRILIARTAIEVYDRPSLVSRLGFVWTGFRAALRTGDVAAAASFVHSDRRAAWAAYLARLTPAQLAATDAMFTEIALQEVTPGRAECDMVRDKDGLLYSFPVSFEIDMDGGWRLWQF